MSGSSGSGKTHLLVWLATACTSPGTPAGQRPDATLGATGLTLDSATWLLAGQLGLTARTPAQLRSMLAEDDRPRLLFVWDLNRSAEPPAIAGELLDGLLGLPGLRLVVDCATGTPEASALTALTPAAVLELDEPRWTDPVRFGAWQRRLGGGRPPADLAYPNPGLARLASRIRDAAAATHVGVPAAWWAEVPKELHTAFGALATFDRPVLQEEWALLADPVAVSRAAALLPADSPTEDTWWLRPGPLRQLITAQVPVPSPSDTVHTAARAIPRLPDGGPDLAAADPERLGLLLRQAVRAGTAGQLLDDVRFLARAEPVSVAAALAAVPDTPFRQLWRAAGPGLVAERNPAVRSEMLRTRLLGQDGAEVLEDGAGASWRAEWACWFDPAQPEPVAAALGSGPYAGRLLVAAADGGVRLLDLASRRLSPESALLAPKGLRALTCLPDGSVIAVDPTGVPRLLTGSTPPGYQDGEFGALAPLPAAGDVTGTVHWHPADGEDLAQHLHDGPVTALGGVLLPPAGPTEVAVPLLLSGGADGRVRAWKPGFPPLPGPVHQRPCPVVSVSVTRTSAGLVTAAAWADGVLRVQRLTGSQSLVQLRLGSPVRAVQVDSDGQIVVVLTDGVVCVGPGREPAEAVTREGAKA
ncbi:hypothetical protein [Kitasatospora sp. NPDC050543]|uniref:hypothetical protein n=1 Tax=Kitasatospora sp. NPDC050543 TaxID=3364054 RepID=UPI00378D57DA